MAKKLVNAGLKSKREAARALLDGRVFYFEDSRIFWDEYSEAPFVIEIGPRCSALLGIWREFSKWQEEIEVEWYEDIPEGGVICWVSDSDISEKRRVALVIEVNTNSGYVFTNTNVWWKCATPVLPEECYRDA